MFYKSFYTTETPNETNYTIDMLYKGVAPTAPTIYEPPRKKTIRTETNYFSVNTVHLNALKQILKRPRTAPWRYTEYHIPKATGGFRLITAPCEELKNTQREVASMLRRLGAVAHDAAFAYEPYRTAKDAMVRHKTEHHNWFYKLDIKDFFPSCTTEVLQTVLEQVYPFCCFDEETLTLLIECATYKDCLPQGSPLSPLLCNMVLTPFDFIMQYSVKPFDGTYTRYADDILISTPNRHQLNFIEYLVQKHLNEVSTSFKLKKEKSRCGSKNGANWNLGLMLNKDNNVTLGHKKKMELKAKINNFIFDFTNKKYWSIIDTQVLQGELNYFKTIEPDYANFVINRLQQKYKTSCTLAEMFSAIITERVHN